MFVVHQKGLKLDGNNPTLLYAYGGFNVSQTPSFSATLFPWFEAGGVYALACLRGGGEYGDAWHEAGMLEKKQNVFDDFIAAAEWLVAQKYTSPAKLAVLGGSNGGLLTGAVLASAPSSSAPSSRRAAPRHAPLPVVPDGALLDPRVRQRRERRPVQVPPRLLAVPAT